MVKVKTNKAVRFHLLILFMLFMMLALPGLSESQQNLQTSSKIPAEQVVQKLEARFKSISTLRADFQQFYYSPLTREPAAGRGQVFIRRPDRMRWEYTEPEKQIFLLKDGQFWLYFPEDRQLIKNAHTREVQESEILGLLAGNFSLSQRYRIEFSSFPGEGKNTYQLRLEPHEEGQFSHIFLEIDGQTWLITRAIFFEPDGGKLEYRFNRVRTGLKFPEELFELKIPPDCEIIETGQIK